jgi:hypothetical protein
MKMGSRNSTPVQCSRTSSLFFLSKLHNALTRWLTPFNQRQSSVRTTRGYLPGWDSKTPHGGQAHARSLADKSRVHMEQDISGLWLVVSRVDRRSDRVCVPEKLLALSRVESSCSRCPAYPHTTATCLLFLRKGRDPTINICAVHADGQSGAYYIHP